MLPSKTGDKVATTHTHEVTTVFVRMSPYVCYSTLDLCLVGSIRFSRQLKNRRLLTLTQ